MFIHFLLVYNLSNPWIANPYIFQFLKDAYRLHQYKPADAELAIIPDADHMFNQDAQRQEVTELVVKWFRKLALKDGF